MVQISRRTLLGGLTITGAAVAIGYVSMPGAAPADSENAMTPPEVLSAVRAKEILLVDVRRPDEWEKTGVAEGAVPIDLRRDDFVEAVKAALGDQDLRVAVICARGVRSRRMTRLLNEAGLGPIIDVPEGMLGSSAGPGWLKRELPLVSWSA